MILILLVILIDAGLSTDQDHEQERDHDAASASRFLVLIAGGQASIKITNKIKITSRTCYTRYSLTSSITRLAVSTSGAPETW